uniref:WSC domain-containing protein n=1 Tax=Alexandrium andersonii TaxID=327968 RepID=A0A7S2IB20_9DINO|mmetsp:Transcript_81167/g.181588  ORF Transcript_81167/g.181588 Transcript_81167/m.181588 type:complete len:470 (+) Transcript_81167:97-1506(+)
MATRLTIIAVALLLLDGASAARHVGQRQRLRHVGHETLATLPMHLYREDCWNMRPISMLSKAAADRLPGAGMDQSAITPFAKVLKDGYYEVECVADYMFVHGDKFGDNKYSYDLGDVSNVSIVHYSAMVPKEDQQAMTHETCFAFCRTVPDMLFFGIKNGRECYCAPYYKPIADDSSSCDAVCEGDTTTMCGGKSKSSMFSMHQCTDTKSELTQTESKMDGVSAGLTKLIAKLTSTGTPMQTVATAEQATFGNVGDGVASDLMQSAKKFAGELEASVVSAEKINTDMTGLKSKAAALAADLTDFQAATEAETVMRQMEKSIADGEAQTEAMQLLADQALPANASSGAADQYYPVMYFVDKKGKDVPSTCGGDAAGSPMVATMEECASECDSVPGKCVGFSHFKHADGELCFLFSKLKSATYYAGCGNTTDSASCVAKLQYYSGTTLKPDGSGKCEQCLKTVTKADRCYQ